MKHHLTGRRGPNAGASSGRSSRSALAFGFIACLAVGTWAAIGSVAAEPDRPGPPLVADPGGAPGTFVAPGTASTQDDDQDKPPRMLSINGMGEASAPPDIAYIDTGVVTQADTAAEALAANTKAMDALFKGLEELGVAKKDMQTSQFSVSPVYDQPKDGNQAPQIRAYQVTNQLVVTIRKLDSVGATLDKLVTLGSNRLDNIRFGIENPEPLLDTARKAAVANALHKAKLYAEAAGVTLGPILSINEGGGMIEPPRPMMRMMAAEAASAVPVSSGEQKLSTSVGIVYTLQ